MTEEEKKPAGQSRVSLTRQQYETAAGAELLSLCQSVTADGSLASDEIASLHDWLSRHRGESLPAIIYLVPVVERILQDGVVTPDEQKELFVAIERILPPDIRGLSRAARRDHERAIKEQERIAAETRQAAQRIERARTQPIDRFDFMVAGTRHEGRPAVIERFANVADSIFLLRDKLNRFSENAVQVATAAGHVLGFVPEDHARDLAPLMDAGHPYTAHIKKMLYGQSGNIPVVVAAFYDADASVDGLKKPQSTSAVASQSAEPAWIRLSDNFLTSVARGVAALIVIFLVLKACSG